MPSSFVATHSRTMSRPSGTAATIQALRLPPAQEESPLRRALFGSAIDTVGLIARDDTPRDCAIA